LFYSGTYNVSKSKFIIIFDVHPYMWLLRLSTHNNTYLIIVDSILRFVFGRSHANSRALIHSMLLALSGAIVLHSSVDCLCTESTKMDSTSPTIYVVVVPLLWIGLPTVGAGSKIRNKTKVEDYAMPSQLILLLLLVHVLLSDFL
jgi:hypothetical protein